MESMKYIRQEHGFSCGPACACMMLSALGIDIPQARMIEILGSGPWRGTWHSDWCSLNAYGLDVQTGEGGALAELERRRHEGWQQSLLVTEDVPHYLVYLGLAGGELIVHDPWDTPYHRLPVDVLMRQWQVEDIWNPFRIYDSWRWSVAVKRRE